MMCEKRIFLKLIFRASSLPPSPSAPLPTVVIVSTMHLPTLPPGSTICIVGGGSSGIFALREALKVGWIPTLYEQSSSVGGVWRSDNHWKSLTTNSSYEMMEIPGHPFPFIPSGVFPTRKEICLYVDSFVNKYHLSKYIHFNKKVLDVINIPNINTDHHNKETWNVTITNSTTATTTTSTTAAAAADDQQETINFDLVLVASGQFNLPKLPICLQTVSLSASQFQGHVLHSREFRNGADYVNKNVLVVGLGITLCCFCCFLV